MYLQKFRRPKLLLPRSLTLKDLPPPPLTTTQQTAQLRRFGTLVGSHLGYAFLVIAKML